MAVAPSPTELNDIIGHTGDEDLRAHLAATGAVRVHLAKELWHRSDLHHRRFDDLFIGMGRVSADPPASLLGVRAANVVRTSGWNDWAALGAVTPLQLMATRNLGRGSFEGIAELIIGVWASAPPDPNADIGRDIESPEDGSERAAARPQVDPQLGTRVAEWLWMVGGCSTLGEAVTEWPRLRHSAPPEIHTAMAELADVPLWSVAGREMPGEDGWLMVSALADRDARVLETRRYAFDEPRLTLDELGREFNVTRERIRQIESAAAKRIEQAMLTDAGDVVRHLAGRLRFVAGPVTDITAVIDAAQGLVEATSRADGRYPRLRCGLLLEMAGPYTERAGFVMAPNALKEHDRFTETTSSMEPGDVFDDGAFDAAMDAIGARGEQRDALASAAALRRVNHSLIRWGNSHNTRAIAVLRAYGGPLPFDTLHDEVGFDANPRSLGNALAADATLMRRGKDTWGLREWGGEEYSGILEELEQVIERAGGAVPLDEVVARFVTEFGVTEASVRSYAADRRFVRDDDGNLLFRGIGHGEATVRFVSPEDTSGLTLLDGVWHQRLEVDSELLRGSGRILRSGAAFAAGLEPDVVFAVDIEGCEVMFSWRNKQPTIGRLRAVAVALAAVEGDLLLLPLAGSEPRSARLIAGHLRRAEDGVRRLAIELGLDPADADADEHPLEVGGALGLPPGSDWPEVSDRLADRGDVELHAMLPEQLR